MGFNSGFKGLKLGSERTTHGVFSMTWMEGREYYRSLLVVFHIFGGQAPVGQFLLLSNVSSLPLAARHRTQKVIQPLASLTTRDSAIHSLQHTEPIHRHTSTNIWPPVEPPIHTPHQFLVNLKELFTLASHQYVLLINAIYVTRGPPRFSNNCSH